MLIFFIRSRNCSTSDGVAREQPESEQFDGEDSEVLGIATRLKSEQSSF